MGISCHMVLAPNAYHQVHFEAIISSTGGGEGLLPIRPTYSPPPLSHAPNDLHRARAAPYTHLLPPSPLEPLPSAQH
jgi:hypothetical protein